MASYVTFRVISKIKQKILKVNGQQSSLPLNSLKRGGVFVLGLIVDCLGVMSGRDIVGVRERNVVGAAVLTTVIQTPVSGF